MRFPIFILSILALAMATMAQSAYDDPQTQSWREICDNNYFSGLGLLTPWEADYRMGIDMGNVSCTDLSMDWDVYNRRLSPADVGLVKSGATAASGANVYFSLYNRRSGVLRTFIWIAGQQDKAPGDYYSLMLSVKNDPGSKYPDHSLLAYEGAGNAYTVIQRMDLNKNTDRWYFTDKHVPETWLIEDTFLSFDMNGSHPLPLYLDYYLMSHSLGEIKLTGQVGNDNSKVVTLGTMETAANVYNSVSAGFTKGTKAYKGGVDDMWTFGQNLGNIGATSLGKSIMDLSTMAAGISQGASGVGAIWGVSNLISGFLGWGKGRQVGMVPQAISLNGTITTKNGITNPRIPIANANFTIENQKAMFARTYNTASDKNLGLFVMNSAPDVKVFEVLGGSYGQSNSGEGYYKARYYISIADPTCGLYINPASGAKLKEVKVAPVIHFDESLMGGLDGRSEVWDNGVADLNPAFAAKEYWNKVQIIDNRKCYGYSWSPIEKPTVTLKISFVFDIGRGEVFEAVNTYTPQSISYTRIPGVTTASDFGTCSQPDFLRNALEQGSTANPIWSESGGPNWYSLFGYPGAVGSSVAVSGKVGDYKNSAMSVNVTGSGASFRWKVSSEPYCDKLQVMVDYVLRAEISGQTDWATQDLSFPYGTHTITFNYVKDSSFQLGEDRGMVDQLIIR